MLSLRLHALKPLLLKTMEGTKSRMYMLIVTLGSQNEYKRAATVSVNLPIYVSHNVPPTQALSIQARYNTVFVCRPL